LQDTDKDLKFVHVFPRVDLQDASVAPEDTTLTPEELIVFADISAFQTMISKKTSLLTQRRRALDVIKAARARLAAIETKLAEMQVRADSGRLCCIRRLCCMMRLCCTGRLGHVHSSDPPPIFYSSPFSQELTADDQQFYDSANDEGLQQKQEVLQVILDNMINKGQLTRNEQKEVLVQLQEKLDAIDTQIQAAAAAGQAKKEEKLKEVRSWLFTLRCPGCACADVPLRAWLPWDRAFHAPLHPFAHRYARSSNRVASR
jgi:hypothetical protein